MNRPWLSLLAGTLLATLSVEAAQLNPLDVNRLAPPYLVKVTRLTGLGPDGTRQQLMASPEGMTVPVDDFSSLATHLTVKTETSPAVYHILQAELAPGVFVLDEAGNVIRVAQSGNLPMTIPLVGAVLSQNGEIQALGINPELPRTEPPCPDMKFRDHDD